jgi:hypothetical protein
LRWVGITKVCPNCNNEFHTGNKGQIFCSKRCAWDFRARPEQVQIRFWKKVNKTDSCWNWTGGIINRGYGLFWDGDKFQLAHRFSYELVHGKIPENMTIDHLCRNHLCVNPLHLEVVTMQVNQLRGFGQGGLNARKTHCPRGHPLTPENIIKFKNNRNTRQCRICKNERERAKRKELREVN